MTLKARVPDIQWGWTLGEYSNSSAGVIRRPQFGNKRLDDHSSYVPSAVGLFGRYCANFSNAYFPSGTTIVPPTGDMTICFLVKTGNNSVSLAGWNNNNTGDSGVHDREFWIDGSGHVNWYCYDGGIRIVTGTTAIDDDVWHSIVGVIEGGTIKLYIDGVSEGTPIALTGGSAYNSYTTPYFLVGKQQQGISATAFTGKIQDVAVLNVGLSADEAAEFHNSGSFKSILNWGMPAGSPTGYEARLRVNYNTNTIPATTSQTSYAKRVRIYFDTEVAAVLREGGGTARFSATDPDGTEVPIWYEAYYDGTNPAGLGLADTGASADLASNVFTYGGWSPSIARNAIIQFQTVGSTGITQDQDYYFIPVDDTHFQIAATRNGAALTGFVDETGLEFRPWIANYDLYVLVSDILTSAIVGDLLCHVFVSATATDQSSESGVFSGAGYAARLSMDQDPSGTGPQMWDSVTETYIGTSSGSMTSGDLVAGQVGDAIDFDGSDDVIGANSLASILETGSATLEAIVKINTATDSFQVVLSDAPSDNDLAIQYGDAFSNSIVTNKFHAFCYTTTFRYATGTSTPTTGTFYSVATVYDNSANTLTIAMNGVIEATATSVTRGTSTPATHFGIGDRSPGSGETNFTNGVIDEVRVSTSVRDEDYLLLRYNEDFDIASTFLRGSFEYENPSGPSADDYLILWTPIVKTRRRRKRMPAIHY